MAVLRAQLPVGRECESVCSIEEGRGGVGERWGMGETRGSPEGTIRMMVIKQFIKICDIN